MKAFLKKLEDNSNNGGKVWAWVAVGGTTIGVVAANLQTIMQMLTSIFGIK